MKREAILNLKK
jgi:dynein heavy chain 1